MLEIYRKLGNAEIKYDVPLRASLATAVKVIERFSGEQSGGDRPLALTAALFQIVGHYFGLFALIKREKINASDKASGQVADIESVDADGRIVMAVEVKDRALRISDFDEKLGATREKRIEELFFVTARGNKRPEIFPERPDKEFSAGQNLYVFSLIDLTRSVLAFDWRKIETGISYSRGRTTGRVFGYKTSSRLEKNSSRSLKCESPTKLQPHFSPSPALISAIAFSGSFTSTTRF
ncbi:MAG: restriction endonuclease, SacI family [Bryobacteraceae bacterium]